MRITLQDKLTRRYVREPGEWTPFSWQALDFGSFEQAAAFVRENQLTDVQIEIGFVDTGQKFLLPLNQPETSET